jgi:hypothetical protein
MAEEKELLEVEDEYGIMEFEDDTAFTFEEDDDDDDENLDDILPPMEDLAAAARAAVRDQEDLFNTDVIHGSTTDWSQFKMVDLRNELTMRGLPTVGKKTDLIAALAQSDLDQESAAVMDDDEEEEEYGSFEYDATTLVGAADDKEADLDSLFGGRGSDLETLAATAEAVLEMEKPVTSLGRDWSKLTVAQLRTELDKRGLPTVGKKADLVVALESADRELDGNAEEEKDVDNLSSNEYVFTVNHDYDDELSEDDLLNDLLHANGADREALAAAARASVDREGVLPEPSTDWSRLSPTELRIELDNRGLPTVGRKGDLVASLQASDRDLEREIAQLDREDRVGGLGDLDMAAVARAAREAVKRFESVEEPSDEDLLEIEKEPLLSSATDYGSLTLAELKDELRQRGLPLSGNKADLIAKLTASDQV